MLTLNRIAKISLPLAIAVLTACAGLQGGYELPPQHPVEADLGARPPICSDCHQVDAKGLAYSRYNHSASFAGNHRQEATQSERVCALCHQTSFCNDCHATRVELKPSIKNQGETYRKTPHRGDYLTRHRFDGRVDPTSCFRCHGNPKAAKTCVACHG
jgi:hypothetical protein